MIANDEKRLLIRVVPAAERNKGLVWRDSVPVLRIVLLRMKRRRREPRSLPFDPNWRSFQTEDTKGGISWSIGCTCQRYSLTLQNIPNTLSHVLHDEHGWEEKCVSNRGTITAREGSCKADAGRERNSSRRFAVRDEEEEWTRDGMMSMSAINRWELCTS